MINVNYQFILHFIVSFIVLIRSTSDEDLSEYGVTPGVSRTSCPCGRLNKNQARIVGGDEVERNEFPFMVGIRTQRSPFVFCGGTIISAHHVLTAAHCTEPKRSEKLAVTVGDHNIYDPQDTQTAAVLSVKEIIEHELYDKRGDVENDIALLVTEKIGFNPFVEPACMPKEKINLEGQSVKVIGWGKLSPKGPYSEVLHKVNLKVVPLAVCDNYFYGIDIRNPNQMCTLATKADSCQGDSGGPVLWRDPQTNRYVLVGIVSFGDHCGREDAPTVNTDVYFHRDWIEQKIAVTRSKAVTCSKI
ncbi:venom serine protease 34-like isoform X1 [Rhodnius prolixus]|uniref:venom serine protease 34-like isoform X1 n=1 Tax=Rhodnius prolixus TaxID=13249 RepID=UPI003D188CF8